MAIRRRAEAASSTTEPVRTLTGMGRWTGAWAEFRRERLRRRAMRQAWAAFRACAPAWWSALFDEPMLKRPLAAEAVAARDAEALARVWAGQFRYQDPRRRDRDVRRATDVAELFLRLLRAEEARFGRG